MATRITVDSSSVSRQRACSVGRSRARLVRCCRVARRFQLVSGVSNVVWVVRLAFFQGSAKEIIERLVFSGQCRTHEVAMGAALQKSLRVVNIWCMTVTEKHDREVVTRDGVISTQGRRVANIEIPVVRGYIVAVSLDSSEAASLFSLSSQLAASPGDFGSTLGPENRVVRPIPSVHL